MRSPRCGRRVASLEGVTSVRGSEINPRAESSRRNAGSRRAKRWREIHPSSRSSMHSRRRHRHSGQRDNSSAGSCDASIALDPRRLDNESVQTSLGLFREVSGHLRLWALRFSYVCGYSQYFADFVVSDSFGWVGGGVRRTSPGSATTRALPRRKGSETSPIGGVSTGRAWDNAVQ